MRAFLALSALSVFAGVAKAHYLVQQVCEEEAKFCDKDGFLRFNEDLLDDVNHPCHEWDEDRTNEVCTTALFESRCKSSGSSYWCGRNNFVLVWSKNKVCTWDKERGACYLKDDFSASEHQEEISWLEIYEEESTQHQKLDTDAVIEANEEHCLLASEGYAEENGMTLDSKGNFRKNGKLVSYSQVTPICKSFGQFTHNNGRTKKDKCKRYYNRCISNLKTSDLTFGGYSDLRTPPPVVTKKPTPFPTGKPTTGEPTSAPTTAAPTPYTIESVRVMHNRECNEKTTSSSCRALKIRNDRGQLKQQCKYSSSKRPRCEVFHSSFQYQVYFINLVTSSPTTAPTATPTVTPTVGTDAPTDAPTNAPTASCDVECGQFTEKNEETGMCELESDEVERFRERSAAVRNAIEKYVCGPLTVFDADEGGCVADLYAVAQIRQPWSPSHRLRL